MSFKIFAVLIFIAILVSLGNALFHLVKSQDLEESRKTARALTLRISLSLGLFVLLVIALATGLFQPTGIGARLQQQSPNQPTQTAKP
jgi:uncharacterized membrane protein